MPSRFVPADHQVVDQMWGVLKSRFPRLVDENLNIEVLMAFSRGDSPAVSGYGGAAALAKIKVVGPEERATGGPDLRISVDAIRYEKFKPRRQQAIFAHELNHIVVAKDKKRRTKRDDYNRPVTKLRPDDWVITGFKMIADWYGDDSIERLSYERLGEALSQSVFSFYSKDDEPETVPVSAAKVNVNAELLAGVREVEAARGHVHTRACYDDPGPGHGSPQVICDQVEGDRVPDAEVIETDLDKVLEAESDADAAEHPWRDCPIADLDLPPETIEWLTVEKSFRTAGELADWISPGGRRVAGVGRRLWDALDKLRAAAGETSAQEPSAPVRTCTRCNTEYPGTASPCPKCRNPEFSVNGGGSSEKPKRGRKRKAGAA